MKLIIFLILILFLPIASSLELGISPIQLDFSGKTQEKICRNITLFSKNFSGELAGEDRWSKENEKILNKYTLSSEDLKINIEYEKTIRAEQKNLIGVCINANQGVYYGALLFHAENTSAGVGSWIFLNISEKREEKEGGVKEIPKLTGKVIEAREAVEE